MLLFIRQEKSDKLKLENLWSIFLYAFCEYDIREAVMS